MAQKIAKLGIERDNDFLYYIKGGDVWRVPRRQPGVKKTKSTLVAHTDAEMESGFIYFLDKAGDVARVKAKVGGQKRKVKKGMKVKMSPKAAMKSGRVMAKRKVSAKKPAKRR
jgi:hypothetical protein